jgi:hypothetical protein
MAKYKFLLILGIFLFSLIGFSLAQMAPKYVYLFVPNSGGYNSISEIDITNSSAPKEVSRHWTVPSGWYGNPSRTAIDHYGNAWIGNRATNTLVKVGNLGLGTCVDKNGNGKIDTTRDTNNNGVIEDSEMVSFENDECILKEVALPLAATGNFWVVGTMGCAGCHCSGAAQGTIDLTSAIQGTGSYTFPIWCSEAYGGETCEFRIRIEMPDGSIRYIEDGGDYGDISVRAYHSSVYSDCNNDPNTIIQRANTEYNQWYSVDWWPDCDICDFYARIEMNVKNVDWKAIKLEVHADDSMYVWTNSPYYSRQSLSDGAGVRAVCIDANDNVYAGLFDYQKMFYISKDGQILKTIDLSQAGCHPYGCVVDKNGYVWVSCIVDNRLVKYDPKTDKVDSYYQGIYVYGLTPTAAGDGVVFNAWVNSQIRKIGLDGSTIWSVSGPYAGRGITVDKDDNIYAVGSQYGEVWKLDKNGNKLKSVSGVCDTPTGIGLDYYGNVWVACYGDGQIVRLDKDLNVLNRATIGGNHYVYSDWTGYLLTEIVAPLPQYPIIAPPSEFLNLIPLLLGNPLFFVAIFALAVAAKVESALKAGGYAFVLSFLGIIFAYALFSGIVPWWLLILLFVLIIGGILYFKGK